MLRIYIFVTAMWMQHFAREPVVVTWSHYYKGLSPRKPLHRKTETETATTCPVCKYFLLHLARFERELRHDTDICDRRTKKRKEKGKEKRKRKKKKKEREKLKETITADCKKAGKHRSHVISLCVSSQRQENKLMGKFLSK